MGWLQIFSAHYFLLFTFVLARISGLASTAPIFGTQDVPMQVRALLAFSLALVVTPAEWAVAVAAPTTLPEFALQIGGEVLIGLILGIGVNILFSGIQVAGQVISQMSGMNLADIYNPQLDSEVPIFAQFAYMVTMAVFVIMGGHRHLLSALLDTFEVVPPGMASVPRSLGETVVALLTQSFELGIRSAAPAIVALLLATVIMGLISRTVPQLNVLSLGFGINSLVTLGVLSISLGTIAWLFQEQIDPLLSGIVESLALGGS